MALKNKKRDQQAELTELVLPSPEGVPWVVFPGEVVEPVRRLIARIGRREEIPLCLSFFAALRQEGVSFISSAFATALADDRESSVCLVDLNWFWPSELAQKIPATGGLGAVLSNQISLGHAIVQTGKPNLAVLPAGELPIEKRSYYARSAQLKETLLKLMASYDHLVLDIPAILATNDAIPLASLGTACCLVIHQGVTSSDEVKSALSDLDHIPMLGVILNKYKMNIPAPILNIFTPFKTVSLS